MPLALLRSSLRAERDNLTAAVELLESALAVRRYESSTADDIEALRGKVAAAFVRQGTDFLKRFASLKSLFEASSPKSLMLYPYPEPVASAGNLELIRYRTVYESVRGDEWGPLWDATAEASAQSIEEAIQHHAENALASGMRETVAMVHATGTFDLTNPRAAAYLKSHGAEQVTRINQTTRAQLRTILEQANAEGWSYQTTAREIRNRFNGFAGKSPIGHIRDRAELVAVTEVGNAYEAGAYTVAAGLQDRGLLMEKHWYDAGDARVHPGCLVDTAAGWIPLNNRFPSGVMQPLDHPG